MSLCSRFNNRYIPFLLVPFFAGVITFLTWITLSVAGASSAVVELTSILVFLAIGGLMAVYLVHCQNRKRCGHD